MTTIYESEMAQMKEKQAAATARKKADALETYRRILRTPKPGDGAHMLAAMETLGITDAQHEADKAELAKLSRLESDMRSDDELSAAEAEMRRVVDGIETEWRAMLCEMVNRLPGVLSPDFAPIQGMFFRRDYGARFLNLRPWESFDALKNAHMLLGERIPQDDRENWANADYDVIERLDGQRRAAVSKFDSLKFQSERANADAHALRKGNPRVFGDAS